MWNNTRSISVCMKRHQYRNPPIEEAVCELRFVPGSTWNLTVPGLFYEKVRDSYPGEPRQQNLIATEVQINPQPTSPHEITVSQGVTKLLFPSANNQRLVGVGPDVLSIHILRPYQGWDEFHSKINEALQAYQEVTKPIGVKRIALRYINRIVIPREQPLDLSEYFTIPPQIPKNFPSTVSAFLTRIELGYEDLPIKLALTFSDAIAPAGQTEFIIDLEISQDWTDKSLPLQDALSHLDELKQRERQAFEDLITDRARELFDAE